MPSLGSLIVEIAANTAAFRSDMDRAIKKLGEFGGAGETAKRIFEVFSGISLSHITEEIARAGIEAVKMAHAAELAEFAFTNLADKAKISGSALRRSLEEASGQTISVSESLAAAARGLQEGLAPDQLVRLMEIARSASIQTGRTVGETFNDLTTAVANNQVRMLKQMGIVIDVDQAMRRYAESLGVDATLLKEAGQAQAIYNAINERAKTGLVDLNSEVGRHKEELEKLRAAAKDIWMAIGQSALDAFYRMTVGIKALGKSFAEGLGKIGQSLGGPPGTGLLPGGGAAGLPSGGELGAPGVGGLGGTPNRADLIDQERLRRIQTTLAAQRALQSALGGAAVATAAQQFAGAGGPQGAIDALEDQIRLLGVRTAAELRENEIAAANAPTIEERGKKATERIQIQTKSTVELLGLQKQLRDAVLASADAEAKLFEGVFNESQIAQRDIDIDNARAAARQANLKATRELIAVLNTEGAAEPEGGPGAAPKAMIDALVAAQGAPKANYLRSMREIDDQTKIFGITWDSTTPKIQAAQRQIEEMVHLGLDPLGEEISRVRDELEKLQTLRNVFDDVFGGISGAISGTVQGLLQGTQTLSQAFANMGRNIAASIIQNIIQRGLNAAKEALINFAIEASKLGLLGALRGALGGPGPTATPAATGTGTIAPAIGESVMLAQHGGIFTKPTHAIIGEAGPEAVIPLHGLIGGGTTIQIINNTDSTIEHRETRTPDGRQLHQFVIDHIKRAIGSGEFDQIMSPYGLRRQPLGR
jgi:hypothetical protein